MMNLHAFVLDSMEKMVKSLNRRAKLEQLARDTDPISLSASTILVCHHNRQHFVVAPASVVYEAEGLSGALMLAMKLHYTANIKYPDTVKSVYGVLEALSRIPVTVSLRAFAKKLLQKKKLV